MGVAAKEAEILLYQMFLEEILVEEDERVKGGAVIMVIEED